MHALGLACSRLCVYLVCSSLKSILASAIKTKVWNEQKRFGQGRAEELHSRILGGVDAEFMSLLSADITTIGHFFGQRLAELQERGLARL